MKFTLEIFIEDGFNCELSGNILDIVLFRFFHFGVDYSKSSKLLHIVIQNYKKTYFIGFWFDKKHFSDYFSYYKDSKNYKTFFLL